MKKRRRAGLRPQVAGLLSIVLGVGACRPADPTPDGDGGALDPAPPADLASGPDLRVVPPVLPEVQVPGGTYLMGSPPGGLADSDEQPVHSVTVGPLAVGRSEVTVAQYRRCVAAGACVAPSALAETIDACNWGKDGREAYPINCITQPQAATFCAWIGRALPTEEEWEYVARGALDATYPWGEDPPADQLCWEGKVVRERTCPVASYPATLLGRVDPQGVYDLAGNVWEWTADRYCPYTAMGRQECTEQAWVMRGGSAFSELVKNGRGADRFAMPPDEFYTSVGIRCFGRL